METRYSCSFVNGVTIRFQEKPPDNIRAMLKANGFRYSQGAWYCRRVRDGFMPALERACNPDKPDGDCWTCGKPGRFRHEGAATPVRCDECHAMARYWESLPTATRRHYRELSQGTELSAAQLAYTNRNPDCHGPGI
jgi:hypothetical protein